jgi:hypothetical protein
MNKASVNECLTLEDTLILYSDLGNGKGVMWILCALWRDEGLDSFNCF